MEFKHYQKPQTLSEAYQMLNEIPNSIIIGGGTWLKMSNPKVDTLIDLSDLKLDQIKETDQTIEIGAMVTLRDYETHKAIQKIGNGFLSEGITHILGVGFRNIATIGGTIAGKYPFSDVITPLLTLKSELVFFPEKKMSLEDYLNSKEKMHAILTHVIIKKEDGKGFFRKVSKTPLEFATLNVAIFTQGKETSIALGARPQGPILAHEAMDYLNHEEKITDDVINKTAQLVLEHVKLGDNYQASQAYRKELANAYVKRGIKEVLAV